MLNYIDVTKNTCTWSWTVTEIMASDILKKESCCTFIDCQMHIKNGRICSFCNVNSCT